MNKRASSSGKFYLFFKLKDGSCNWLKVKFSFGGGGLKGRENVDAGAAWAEISHQMFPPTCCISRSSQRKDFAFQSELLARGKRERERERREREQSPPGPSGSVAEQ